jgi:hypothetical protein
MPIFLFSINCNERSKPEKVNSKNKTEALNPTDKSIVVQEEKPDTILFVDQCENAIYEATLHEDTRLDSNAFTLTINFNKNLKEKAYKLDLPPGRGKINYCTDEYVTLGFSCGGPCYARVFVFLDKNKPIKIFGYCQRVTSNDNIITHIEDEEFENLIIHNLKNGKEMIVSIENCHDLNFPCLLDSAYMINNNLVLEYDASSDNPKKKIVNIRKILKD